MFILSINLFADDIFVIVVQKQAAKRSTSWSLSEWMMQKKEFALQDQWLALHSSSTLFEFYLAAETGDYHFSREGNNPLQQSKAAHFGAFVSIFGLEFKQEKSNENFSEIDYRFALRVLGKAVQGTNFTLHYGQRKRAFANASSYHENDEFKNNYWGGSLSLYLLPFLGGQALFHQYMEKRSVNGHEVAGDLLELTGFIDFSFVRLYLTTSKEVLNIKSSNGSIIREKRDGNKIGIKIFF